MIGLQATYVPLDYRKHGKKIKMDTGNQNPMKDNPSPSVMHQICFFVRISVSVSDFGGLCSLGFFALSLQGAFPVG